MALANSFVQGRDWLKPSRFVSNLDEIRAVFVDSAPHEPHRRQLVAALELWLYRVREIVPVHTIWVDGGFLTKKLQKPSDIDVVAFVKPGMISAEVERALHPLTTDITVVPRRQPMDGLVDAFVVEDSDVNMRYWANAWMSVKEPSTGETLAGIRKGFVEVKL